MNFLSAVKHTVIGYGIRRKSWTPRNILHMDSRSQLEWATHSNIEFEGTTAELLGGAVGDITADDITATDWETI